MLREEAPDAESLFIVDSEGDTVDKLTSYVKSLPGLEEYTVDQHSAVGFNDAVVIKKDGKIVAGPFELDASELGTKDLVKEALVGYLDKIHQLSFNVSKLEDAALRISGKRKSTIEESKIAESEESTGAMSTFVKPKDESVNKGKSLKKAGKQQPTTPTVNASTDPGKSNYEHLIAMEEGFGGAPNAQGQATSLAGVYDVDQAEEYENSAKQLKSYATGEMSFYGAKGNKNRNPKKGLRTDVTPQVYDDLSDNTKLILQTEHFNLGWDPRVLLLQTAGMLGNNTRGELHNDGDLLLTQWNSVINDPEKLAKFKEALEGNEEELLNNLEKIMKGTSGNQDQYKKRMAYLRNLL